MKAVMGQGRTAPCSTVDEPKKTNARSARTGSTGDQNPLYKAELKIIHCLGQGFVKTTWVLMILGVNNNEKCTLFSYHLHTWTIDAKRTD